MAGASRFRVERKLKYWKCSFDSSSVYGSFLIFTVTWTSQKSSSPSTSFRPENSTFPPSNESLMLMTGWAALRAGGAAAAADTGRPVAAAFSCPLMSIVPVLKTLPSPAPALFSSKSLSEPANVTVERCLIGTTANLVPNDLTVGKHSASRGNIIVDCSEPIEAEPGDDT